jgi:hypothetical protein
MVNVVGYVLPAVFVLAGIGFVAFGAQVIRTGRRLRRYGRHVPGTVVRVRWQRNQQGGGGLFYPTFRFRTADGREIVIESDLGANPAPAREGQQVGVVYDPARPQRARIDSMLGGGMVHGPLFVVFGVVVTLVAAAVLVNVLVG